MGNKSSSTQDSGWDIKNLTKKQKIIIAASVLSAVILIVVVIAIVVAATRCKNDPQIVEDAYYNDIDAVKKNISDGVCVDSFGTRGLVSFIIGDNLTNFE